MDCSVCLLLNALLSLPFAQVATLCDTAIPTYSTRGTLKCGYHKVLLSPHFLLAGQAHMGMQQWPTISALSLNEAVLQVGTTAFR